MANPLPEEDKFYRQIKDERITINPEIWDLLYNHIGDDLSAINLLCQYHLKDNQPIPVEEARKILQYTHHIKNLVNQITSVSQEKGFYFPEIAENGPLHPVLREMFTHYIGNDVYMINLIVQDSIDPLSPEELSMESTRKILQHTHSIRDFMNRLREATSKSGCIPEEGKVSSAQDKDKTLSKEEIFVKIRKLFVEEFNHLNEDKIMLNSRFNEDMNLDSIDAIRVIMFLEENFGIEIIDQDTEGILTVSQAVDYIYKRLRED